MLLHVVLPQNRYTQLAADAAGSATSGRSFRGRAGGDDTVVADRPDPAAAAKAEKLRPSPSEHGMHLFTHHTE